MLSSRQLHLTALPVERCPERSTYGLASISLQFQLFASSQPGTALNVRHGVRLTHRKLSSSPLGQLCLRMRFPVESVGLKFSPLPATLWNTTPEAYPSMMPNAVHI
jgi:hypothetical protein